MVMKKKVLKLSDIIPGTKLVYIFPLLVVGGLNIVLQDKNL